MGKNTILKALTCIIFIIVLLNIFCLPKSLALSNITSSGREFLGKGNDIDNTINTAKLKETSDTIYNTLLGIAVMVAIIVAMVIGIQFMAASADEKAKVKEAILPFVIGCVVVFGAFTIWKIAVNIGYDAEGGIRTTHVSNSGATHGGGRTEVSNNSYKGE